MQEEADVTQVLLLRRIRNVSAVTIEAKYNQKNIMDYFGSKWVLHIYSVKF